MNLESGLVCLLQRSTGETCTWDVHLGVRRALVTSGEATNRKRSEKKRRGEKGRGNSKKKEEPGKRQRMKQKTKIRKE